MINLEPIFSNWQSRNHHKGKLFITDGPIDPERWLSTDKKVLFVAKEAYGEVGETGTWDLPTVVREEWRGPKYKFWWTAAYWALAVRNTSSNQMAAFPEYAEKYTAAIDATFELAVLNIKKSAGVSSSDDEDLKVYVEKDGDLIRKEFDLLDPDITIFCNTWHLVQHLFTDAKEVSQFVLHWGNPPKTFINYWHPANQYPNSIMFYALCAIYQTSLKANATPG